MSNFQKFLIPVGSPESSIIEINTRQPEGTRLSYKNELEAFSEFAVTSSGDQNNNLDLEYLIDYMNTTRYSFGTTGNNDILFDKGDIRAFFGINHVAIAGVPWFDEGVTSVRGEVESVVDIENDITETVEVFNIDTTTFEDNKIVMANFGGFAAKSVRIYFEASGTVTVSIIQFGIAFEFPGLPDDGFQPGAFNSIDEQNALRTVTNRFGSVDIVQRGTEEVYSFTYLPQEFVNQDFAQLISEIKSQVQNPVFISWNPKDFPLDVMFGRIDIGNAVYSTRVHGSVSFNVKGLQGEL